MRRGAVLRELVRGLGAATALLVLLVGVPALLTVVAGWPLPRSLPTLKAVGDALGGPSISDAVLIKTVAIIGWLAWAQLAVCTAVEMSAWLKGQPARRVPLAGRIQVLVRQLVVTATLLAGTTVRPAAAAPLVLPREAVMAVFDAPPPPPEPVAAATAHIPAATVATSGQKTYVVRARDDLWDLAQRHLGDPRRWRELFQLNQGARQPDGRALSDPDFIRPGWRLAFPVDAVGLGQDAAVTTPATPVEPAGRLFPSVSAPVPPVASSRAGKTSSAKTARPTSRTKMRAKGDAHERPMAPVPVGILGSGLMAAGVVATLNRLRRVQQRHRMPGATIRLPDASLAPAEVALRRAADMPAADRLDLSLRALAGCLRQRRNGPPPVVVAVELSDDSVEVLLAEPALAPAGPFSVSAGGRAWTLTASVSNADLASLSEEIAAPVPALISVGKGEGGTVLIDLEAAACTAIAGDEEYTEALFRAVALELATSVWADHLEVVIVGEGCRGLDGLERIRLVDSPAEILDDVTDQARSLSVALAAEKWASTLAARLAPGSSDGWTPTVVLCDLSQCELNELEELVAAAGGGGRGLSVVVLGEMAGADRQINVRGDSVEVRPPGLRLAAPELTVREAQDIARVIAVATDAVRRSDEGCTAPDAEKRVDEQLTEHPHARPVLVPLGDQDRVELDAVKLATQRRRFPEVEVNVLGPVEIVGGMQAVDRRKAVELVVYLALHPKGVDYGRLKTALWVDRLPSQGAFNSTTSLARSRLGRATDGTLHLPHVAECLYRVGPAVSADSARVEDAARKARGQARPEAIETLVEALELVRGLPFEATRGGYEWAHTEGFIARMERVVADCAHQLAELCLDTSDPQGQRAQWAAAQGLKASPGNEVLYRDCMRACDLDGNPGGVEAVMNELCLVADALEPYDTLHPETIALYQQISHRRRRTG